MLRPVKYINEYLYNGRFFKPRKSVSLTLGGNWTTVFI